MAQVVTDPELLKAIDAAPPTPKKGEVTDPQVLAELEGKNVDIPRMLAEGAIEGLTDITGLPADLWNLARAGDLAARSWIRSKIGLDPRPPGNIMQIPMGGEDIRDFLKEQGVIGAPEAQPVTGGQKVAKSAVRGAAGSAVFGPAAVLPGAAGSAASETAGQYGLGPWARAGIGLAAGVGTGIAQNAALKSIRALTGHATENPMVAAMEAENVTPRLAGDVTERGSLRLAESALSRSFGGAEVMKKAVDKTVREIDKAVDQTASRFSTASTAETAGLRIQEGIKTFVKDFRARHLGLLNKIPIGNDERFPVNHLMTYWDDLAKEFGTDQNTLKAFTEPGLTRIMAAVATDAAGTNGTVRWQTIKAIRSRIGEMIADPDLVSDIGKGRLRGMYGALSEDLRDAATSQGVPALRAFERANTYYRAGMERIDSHLQRLADARIPERSFEIAMAGRGGNVSDLIALKRSLPKTDWDAVPATVLRNLGRKAEGGDFDPVMFFRNWTRLDQGTKDTLFRGTRYHQASQSIDRLAKIAETTERSAEFINRSNTAGNLFFLQVLGGAGARLLSADPWDALIGAAGATVTPWAAAKLMTSPAFVKWLATPVGAGRIPMHVSALTQVVRTEPDIAEAAKQFTQAVEAATPLDETASPQTAIPPATQSRSQSLHQ